MYRKVTNPVIPFVYLVTLIFGCSCAQADDAKKPIEPGTLEMTAPTGSICRTVFVIPGQQVQRGERLVALQQSIAFDNTDQLRTDVRDASNQFGEQRNHYLKTLQDFQRGSIATTEVERARADMEKAKKEAAISRGLLHRAEHARRPLILYSPADASVQAVHVTANQTVNTDDILITLKASETTESESGP